MPDPVASLHLDPNTLRTGQVATARVQSLPDLHVDKPLTLELVEVDTDAQKGDVVAAWKVKVTGGDGAFVFTEAERQAVAADVDGDMELPGPKADKSRDGKLTYPTKITWRRAHLRVQLHGTTDTHLVIVRVADGRDLTKREGMIYELGLVLKDDAGAVVFDSGTQVVTLDCWDALTENCVAAVKNQYEGHQFLCEQRPDTGGDYYGSHSSQTSTRGKVSTDCVTYALQVMDRAYAECRAASDARYLRNNAQYGSKFAPALQDAGWALVFFCPDSQALLRSNTYNGGVWKKVLQTQKLWGKPVAEAVYDYGKSGTWDARTDEYTEPEQNEAMLARYEQMGDTVPFGVLALSLGSHVVMKVDRQIYECHWSAWSTDPNLLDRDAQSWESLKASDCFFMACPAWSLRPPPPPPLERIQPRPLVVPTPDLRAPVPIRL